LRQPARVAPQVEIGKSKLQTAVVWWLWLLIALCVVALFSQPYLRRAYNQRLLAPAISSLDAVTLRDASGVTGSVQGRLQGRPVGLMFVSGGGPKSMVEVWAECGGSVPFTAKAMGEMFGREFEFSSSRRERLDRLQQRGEFRGATQAMSEAGAQSLVFAGTGRVTATFHPYRRELLKRQSVEKILRGVADVAQAIESEGTRS
jgi:hypothetical protein